MTPTPISLAQTVPVNSQLVSCQRCPCELPQAPQAQDVLPTSLISINGPTIHFITNTRRKPGAILDCPQPFPCSLPHVIHQNGPASLSPKCFLIISLPYHCYYHYICSCQFSPGLLQCLFCQECGLLVSSVI